MFTLEDFMNARDLKQQGWSVSAIAQQLDIDRKTVRKYLLEQVHPYQRASPAPCKVDPYRPFLRERWEQGVHNARKLLDEIRGRGYRHNLDGYAPALAQVRGTNGQGTQPSQAHEDHPVPAQSNLSLVITMEGFINIVQACEFRLRYLDPATTDAIWGIDVLLANGRNHLFANNDPGFDQLIDALEDQGYTISVADKTGGSI